MLEKSHRFLLSLGQNMSRDWFTVHKADYQAAKQEFEVFCAELQSRICAFDFDLQEQDPKSFIFRIFRDTRFSKSKEPYKRNFGTFVADEGRKSSKAGYY